MVVKAALTPRMELDSVNGAYAPFQFLFAVAMAVLASFIAAALAQTFNGPTPVNPTFGFPTPGNPTFGFPTPINTPFGFPNPGISGGLGPTTNSQPSSVNCYGNGLTPASDCNQFIAQFCGNVANIQTPSGDSVSACFNQQNGNKCNFIALNNISGGQTSGLNVLTCQSVLQAVTGRCQSGGWGQQDANDYTFTVDPNRGRCDSNVDGGS
ncbi:hypothetical protein NP233_g12420 [Leucocoprinus birnbaumii]|uniref:Glycan binding protein Y3-like domain-containing protein n=1 Tax=Leucocoprinus birnbaumii TaxID=56174 RepID=A0AAD5VFQ6_9AGAR|nr:hypothetical protein NP233_g12420 [Leucocoprinus birnbaumii]